MGSEPCLKGRIAILGSGREGLAAFDYITALGTAESLEIITEGRSGRGREAELDQRGLLTVCPFGDADLESFDWLIRSPGVSPYRRSLEAAAKSGVRFSTPSTLWFHAHPDAKTIAITGTKGKSTTAALLAHLLRHLGLRVELAGNIGTPLLACDDSGVDWWVIELSSYQTTDLEARPTLGVLLNLGTDHLDWHGSEARYRYDKLRLADLVEPGGLLANRDDPVLRAGLEGRPAVDWFSPDLVDTVLGREQGFTMPPSLPGRHNRVNVAACLAVLGRLGLDAEKAVEPLDSFEGLPHRLQRLDWAGGVEFIDDSISTAPVALVAALEALRDRTVILLAGGLDRGIDWGPYAREIRQHPPAALITMPNNGSLIAAALEKAGVKPELGTIVAESLEDAVEKARGIAPEEAVVLLSPGAPSFPQFRDFEDRGRQFARFCGFE